MQSFKVEDSLMGLLGKLNCFRRKEEEIWDEDEWELEDEANCTRILKKMSAFLKNDTTLLYEKQKRETMHEASMLKYAMIRDGKHQLEDEYAKKLVLVQKRMGAWRGPTYKGGKKRQMLGKCFEEIRSEVRSNVEKRLEGFENKVRKNMLFALLLDAAYKLFEEKICVKVRPQDLDIVRALLPQVVRFYTDVTSRGLTIEIMEERLDAHCLGGVTVSSDDDRVMVDQRLEARINECMRQEESRIRNLLAPSQTRKWTD